MTSRLEWVAEFVVRLGIGSTLLLLTGLLAMAVCRRQSASLRYWIGTWTALALLLLPLAAAALPCWQLGWLDIGRQDSQLEDPSQPTVHLDVSEPTIGPPQGFAEERLTSQLGVSRLGKPTSAITSNSTLQLNTSDADVHNQQSPGESPSHELSASQFIAGSSIILFLLIFYALGLGVSLWQLSFAHYAIGQWIRTARADLPESILQIAEDCRTAMGLSGELSVRLSNRVAVPVVAGMLRPTILLPESVVNWPVERVRAAVAHELAHIERGDLWTQLLSQLVQCIYWPQPLVYWWSRRLRIEREAACDDRVLACDPRPTQYARHLLDVAAELTGRGRAQPAALAMARGTQVERRIAAILSSSCRRAPPARIMLSAMCAGAIIGTLIVASVSPFTALKGQEIDDAKVSAPSTSNEKKLHTFRGRVVFADGRPAAGARVRNLPATENYPGVTTVADANGKYELVLPESSYHAPFIADLAEARGFTQVELTSNMQELAVEMEVADIVLKEGKRIEVEVVDETQTPIAEAAVYVQASNGVVTRLETDASGKATVVYPAGLRLQTIGAVKASVGCDYHAFEKLSDFAQGSVSRPKPPQDFEGMIRLTLDGVREASVKAIGPDGKPLAGVLMEIGYSSIKDRDHIWVVYGLPEFARETDSQGIAYFDMLSSHENGVVGIVPRLKREDWYVSGEHGGANINWDKSNKATIQLAEKLLVGGEVRYDDGDPAAGIAIRAAGDFNYCFGFNERVRSDEQGHWQMWVKPNGYYMFAVQDEQFAARPHSGVIVFDRDPPQNLDFQLESARRVHGKIAGLNDEPAHVMLRQRAKDYYDLPQDQRLPNPENNNRPITVYIQDVARVAKDGTFEFRVGPGDLRFGILTRKRNSLRSQIS
ncbi:MAG: M56 family metallopeptidase [Pirellulaceae bacterium]